MAIMDNVNGHELEVKGSRVVCAKCNCIKGLHGFTIEQAESDAVLAYNLRLKFRGKCQPLPQPDRDFPQAGDAVRLVKDWYGVKAGAIGVLGGTCDGEHRQYPSGPTFNPSSFRDGEPGRIGVSCSGGPATIVFNTAHLTPTNETMPVRFWKWESLPCANGGIDYVETVKVWEWDGQNDLDDYFAEVQDA